METKHIATIWRKELRDTVRDRRTLFSMVLIPMLLMPLLIVGMMKFMQTQQTQQAEKPVKLGMYGGEFAPELAAMVGADKKFEIVASEAEPKQAVAEGKLDAALVIPADFSQRIGRQETAPVTFVSKSTNLATSSVGARVSAAIESYNAGLITGRLSARGVEPAILSRAVLVPEDAATQKEVGGFVLGLIIPMFIVMWAIVGGQYTAVDVSAGEKERKTLEALLLTPVKRLDIVLGKFLAVGTVALTSIILAISSFYLSFSYAGKMGIDLQANLGNSASASGGMGAPAFSFSVEPQAILILFGISVLLVALFSAVILSISIFAKSFKEAESYISPAYLVVILPVVFVNAVPGFQPQLVHFLIPAVNAILLFKEVLVGTYDSSHILLTAVSLAVWSLLAVYISSRIYSRESVLFND